MRRGPIALIVPCHRVVPADGGLGGFGWGLPVERWLLDHERPSPRGPPRLPPRHDIEDDSQNDARQDAGAEEQGSGDAAA